MSTLRRYPPDRDWHFIAALFLIGLWWLTMVAAFALGHFFANRALTNADRDELDQYRSYIHAIKTNQVNPLGGHP